jgi:hypothetical protein
MASTLWGIGNTHRGKSNYVVDEEKGIEEFDTTLWFVILGFPIFPRKSYRIQQNVWYLQQDKVPSELDDSRIMRNDQKQGIDGNTFRLSHPFIVTKKLPLNWMQVLKTYLLFYISAILLIVLYVLIKR